jgi:hypothetical protein
MNVDIWQRWTVGMVTTGSVVAQMLTSDRSFSTVAAGIVGWLMSAFAYKRRIGTGPAALLSASPA